MDHSTVQLYNLSTNSLGHYIQSPNIFHNVLLIWVEAWRSSFQRVVEIERDQQLQ